jgi:hypothetical protein
LLKTPPTASYTKPCMRPGVAESCFRACAAVPGDPTIRGMSDSRALPATRAQRGRGSGGVTGKGFRPGQSGNPNGTSRALLDFSAAAREHAPEYLQALLKSLKSSNWRERHSALGMLLDRSFGKPVQQLTGADGQPVSFLHLFAVREVGERVIAELMTRQNSAVIDGHATDGTAVKPPTDLVNLSEPATE